MRICAASPSNISRKARRFLSRGMPLDHKPTQAEFDAVARANAAFHPELRRPRLPPPDLGACSGEGRAYPSFPRRWCTLRPSRSTTPSPTGPSSRAPPAEAINVRRASNSIFGRVMRSGSVVLRISSVRIDSRRPSRPPARPLDRGGLGHVTTSYCCWKSATCCTLRSSCCGYASR